MTAVWDNQCLCSVTVAMAGEARGSLRPAINCATLLAKVRVTTGHFQSLQVSTDGGRHLHGRCSPPILNFTTALIRRLPVCVNTFRIAGNLWRCLGATAISYYHSSECGDGTTLDDAVTCEIARTLADLLVLANLLWRVEPKRLEVRQRQWSSLGVNAQP